MEQGTESLQASMHLLRALSTNWYCKLKNRAFGVRLDKPQFAAAICNQSGRDG
jgi:hypothetical protein